MPKNIVLLSDGTGNSAGKLFKTNVWRLYQALDLSSADPSRPQKTEQIAYYDDGVGTSAFKPLALLGGAFGWGLKRNIIHLYMFLCRNYEPEDRIYCFGFSRGAFTIRVLTGLIANQGLVRSRTEAGLKRLATGAFRAYRTERYKTPFRLERPARAVRQSIVGAKNRVMDLKTYETRATAIKPQITFLGLWDTVAAYGLPIDELTRAWNTFFPLSTPDREPSKVVQRACHALALDDERNTFHPVLWNEANLPDENTRTKRIEDERISQVWFAGMHSSVGGGYPDDALANVSLDWIMEQGERAGLVFKDGERDKIKVAANACGKLYDSRHGLGGTYRYLPRKLALLTNDVQDKNNQVIIKRPKIHESVLERIKRGSDGYAPFMLPPHYAVVTSNGDILDSPSSDVKRPLRLVEHPNQAKSRSNIQEKVWNIVWWKRVVYFTSIFVGGSLVAFPLYRPATSACEGQLCGASWIAGGVGLVLPGMANLWINSYYSHPGTFIFLVALLAALVYIGGRLQVKIFDRMRAIWRTIFDDLGSDTPIAGLPDDLLFRFRTHPFYQRFFLFMKRRALPFIAGFATVLVILAGITQSIFALMSSAGRVCTPSAGDLKPGVLREGILPSNELCWASGVRMEEGKRYRLTVTINDMKEWRDASIQTGLKGFGTDKMGLLMYPWTLFRRHIGEPWFKPIARIGHQGNDEYPLNPVDLSIPGEGPQKLVAYVVARRDGELFLFVNDAILPLPAAWQVLYSNNHGTAAVTVVPVAEPGAE